LIEAVAALPTRLLIEVVVLCSSLSMLVVYRVADDHIDGGETDGQRQDEEQRVGKEELVPNPCACKHMSSLHYLWPLSPAAGGPPAIVRGRKRWNNLRQTR